MHEHMNSDIEMKKTREYLEYELVFESITSFQKLVLDFFLNNFWHFSENAIPIPSWFSDPHDTFLLNLLPFLDALRFVSDVRSVLSRNQTSHNQVW